jgi:hypothetical protein
MKELHIIGTVVYQHLGTGFWGIEAEDGQKWLPLNMPEQLKTLGAHVQITAHKTKNAVSIFMWGTPIEIRSFETIAP